MTRSRSSSRNSARNARNSLFLATLLLVASGCSSSTAPTFLKENAAQAIQDICKSEYKLDVVTRLVGSTMWIYVPLEDLVVPSDKPEKFVEKFDLPTLNNVPAERALSFEYEIKPIPDKEKTQDFKYGKDAIEKINNVWKVIRRVIFSFDRSKAEEPRFWVIVTADIKSGFETSEVFYFLDVKKVSYEYISWKEYQHRSIQDTSFGPQIVGDKEGKHLEFRDLTMKEFITAQILHRAKLKFQKPEVEREVDIDREIAKIVSHVVQIYDYKDFDYLELHNLARNNKLVLNQAALWERTKDLKF